MAVFPSVDLLKMREGTLKNMVVLTRIGLFESKQKHRERERDIYQRVCCDRERERERVKREFVGIVYDQKTDMIWCCCGLINHHQFLVRCVCLFFRKLGPKIKVAEAEGCSEKL